MIPAEPALAAHAAGPATRWKIPPPLTVVLIVTLFFFGMARVGLILQANVSAFLGIEGLQDVQSQPEIGPPVPKELESASAQPADEPGPISARSSTSRRSSRVSRPA